MTLDNINPTSTTLDLILHVKPCLEARSWHLLGWVVGALIPQALRESVLTH